ncbi:hypothetical protein V1477_007183 [Vespula maculifrons]|uniref:Uncharacterized protein n=1 Tax=Vespula maculifrons TaxID=7453 RepID=A0ABD2CHT2_VESMC
MLTIVLCALFTAVHILKTHWLHIRLMRKLATHCVGFFDASCWVCVILKLPRASDWCYENT